jgi:hypothetical protein
MRLGCIKNNPSGKRKLPSGHTPFAFFQPYIEGFTIIQCGSGSPTIMFWSIADPLHKVLPSLFVVAGIKHFLDKVFFEAIFCHHRVRLGIFMAQE